MLDVPYLIPDMPDATLLQPFLQAIDANKQYSNFGPLQKQFEIGLQNCFAMRCQAPVHLTTIANGTLALECALRALDLPQNSLILVPAYSFIASAIAIVRAGYQPYFSDVCPHTWQLLPDTAKHICETADIRAVLPIASFGQPCSTDIWDDFVKHTEIPVIIDAAASFSEQAFGRLCHTMISLHATKSFGIGEGGCIVSQNESFIKACKRLCNFGFGESIEHLGMNAKLSEYHAAVGCAQLQRWPQVYLNMRNVREKLMADLPNQVILAEGARETFSNMFAIKTPFKNTELGNHFLQHGIQTKNYYRPLLSQLPILSRYLKTDLSVSLDLAEHVICLPQFSTMTESQIDAVLLALKKVFL